MGPMDIKTATKAVDGIKVFALMVSLVVRIVPLMVFLLKTGNQHTVFPALVMRSTLILSQELNTATMLVQELS